MSAKQFLTNWLQYFEAANQRNVDLLDRLTDEYFATDVIFHWPGWTDLEQGSAGQKAFMHEIIANNPDFHIAVDDILSAGDKAILRGTLQTNNPITGAVESSAVLEIDHVVDGKIVETWTVSAPGNW